MVERDNLLNDELHNEIFRALRPLACERHCREMLRSMDLYGFTVLGLNFQYKFNQASSAFVVS